MSIKTRTICDTCNRPLGSISDSYKEFLIDGVKRHMCRQCETVIQIAIETHILERYLVYTNQRLDNNER
jgi:RNase P subunit RPR2